MQSFFLAFALVLAAASATAEEASSAATAEEIAILEPEAVPPIPAPGEAMQPVAPLDGPWPAAPAGAPETAVAVDEAGSPLALPPIPAPPFAEPPAIQQAAAPLTGTTGPATAPAPAAKPHRAFDPRGTVHVVEKGDTLWDISDLYLGTPWIWPSIWRDNAEIENPHLILPGDKIWVSATEMRKVTDEEAAALMAAKADGDDDDEAFGVEEDDVPAALAEDVPAVPMPEAPRESFHYMEMATVGVVTKKELKGFARLVGTTEEKVLLAQGDTVFVDLGHQDANVGDEFVLFRTSEKVHDPSTRRVIGYHSEVVGWIQVDQVYDETARAQVRMSYTEFMPSEVYLQPRKPVPTEVVVQDSPPGVEGQVVDLLIDPKYRGGGDVIILNRGSEDGLQVGSPLEIYRPVEGNWKTEWYGRTPDAKIPHEVVASLLVLSVRDHTSMAYVRKSKTELWYGDRFRTVGGPSLEWPKGGIFALPLQVVEWLARVPRPDMPHLQLPNEVAGWEVPRLPLPSLDGYDPR